MDSSSTPNFCQLRIIKHTGKQINCAPLDAASLSLCRAFSKFLSLVGVTINCSPANLKFFVGRWDAMFLDFWVEKCFTWEFLKVDNDWLLNTWTRGSFMWTQKKVFSQRGTILRCPKSSSFLVTASSRWPGCGIMMLRGRVIPVWLCFNSNWLSLSQSVGIQEPQKSWRQLDLL